MKYIPNILTTIRLALVPVLAVLYFSLGPWAGLLTFFIACWLDYFDGFFARKWNVVSNYGKLMDPLADKLIVITAVTCLTVDGVLPVIPVIILAVKELVMIIFSALLYNKADTVVHSNQFGRYSAFVMYLSIGVCVLAYYIPQITPYNVYFVYLAVLLSIVSMVQYGIINVIKPRAMAKITGKSSVTKNAEGQQ